MSEAEGIQLQAVVVEALPEARFKVRLQNGHEALAVISGRMRMHFVSIRPGDTVTVEISPFNFKQGRIVFRGQ